MDTKCPVFIEEYYKAKHYNICVQKQEIERAGKEQESKKRKRETSDNTAPMTVMCEKLKNARKRQKVAVEKAMKKKEEDQVELDKTEKKMMEEVDKEYQAKIETLMKEKQAKKKEVAEKVKVKREKQGQFHQGVLDQLEKEHKAEEVDLMAQMWKQAGDEQEGEQEKKEDVSEAGQSNPDQEHAGPLPPAPDCPICFEPMIPPTRFDLLRQKCFTS